MSTRRPNASKWKDRYIIDVYKLARDGLSEKQMSRVLGIAKATFIEWEQRKSLFKMALEMGRLDRRFKRTHVFDMSQYMYEHLSPKNRIIWQKLNRINQASPGIEKVEAFFANRGKDTRQRMFLTALYSNTFSVAAACRTVGISRETFHLWCKDPDFQALIREVEEVKNDLYESSFIQSVMAGDTQARIAAVKMKLHSRGYSDKQQVDVNVQGTIEHTHRMVLMEELNLPLPVRRAVLNAIRSRKEVESTVVAKLPDAEKTVTK